ncbi:preprotein translocase subunit SecA [Candidatus Kaiserbacteria bacterium CG10_big_fil_rev_8_21_14_0_10_47_16]|uniref:Protein translocase subunit SecA n=1 Tax=Candidatus Kaiserbacteria bacterium CG10_big_fil_rev_8_21_14_0_10_47_16 TaxID=1974608 RepID=A0A2H0UEU1_9BACT|nr:MAG: preprotein translocase subunit SecA [Candidatus Kaiserbacteria bacterium CG10_big_fil_rev_8_21_14_0_10_47_16]
MSILDRFFGPTYEKEIKRIRPIVGKINDLEDDFVGKTDAELAACTTALKERVTGGESLDSILPEAFALVRESAKRTLGLRHYDVQLIGGVILHSGKITEMRTGEGKTLVGTLPAYLNALTGTGVHVVTVNDYLARRDAVWMGQVYALLGLSLGVINQNASYIYDADHKSVDALRDEEGSYKVLYEFLRPCSRKEAYAADIIYGTNNEFGFDYLRDNIEFDAENLRQGHHAYAIIDEVDSILIDEARTPLIISAPAEESADLYTTFARIADRLKKEEHFVVDEKMKSATLTDAGIEEAEKMLGIENIYTDKGIKYVHHLETAVRAKALYSKDKEYVIRDGEVVIVDEFTGRMQPGRRWSDGLHQAVEAKEGVVIQKESRTYASITFQNYFRMYDKLAGMTGTALTSTEEFYSVYGLEVIPVPTNQEVQRIDGNDQIFQTERGKHTAVIRKVKELNEKGQPVLIGTAAIDKNEELSAALTKAGIVHEVLNAKNHEREGEIIAGAGKKGMVTLATNMAGRGVDIKLGGIDATKEEADEVRSLGGLFVLGTERHEARRIDNQLRGRSGRQGDPGETQFFVSMEDNLMRVFAADTVKNMMGRLGIPEDQPIENNIITRSLESAQKKIEGFNFDARKHVLSYDDVLNKQRHVMYEKRVKLLTGDASDVDALLMEVMEARADIQAIIEQKKKEFGEQEWTVLARRLMLHVYDILWVEHLEIMQYTRTSVSLRAYGQQDPLIEYRKEGNRLFKEMQNAALSRIAELIPNVQKAAVEKEDAELRKAHAAAQRAGGAENTSGDSKAAHQQAVKKHQYGRNDMVTITNGTETEEMKYKKAEGLLETGEWTIKK